MHGITRIVELRSRAFIVKANRLHVRAAMVLCFAVSIYVLLLMYCNRLTCCDTSTHGKLKDMKIRVSNDCVKRSLLSLQL